MIDISNFLNEQNIVSFIIKTFSVVLSFLFFIYALIINKQTKIMISIISLDYKNIVQAISYLHIIFGILLILLSLVIV
jgi:hypothetical protein